MAKTLLVEKDVKAGEVLLAALDSADFPVTSASWIHSADSATWVLVIATPLVDVKGPKKAYQTIQKFLAKIPEESRLELLDVTLISPKNPMAKMIHSGMLSDSYLYRIH